MMRELYVYFLISSFLFSCFQTKQTRQDSNLLIHCKYWATAHLRRSEERRVGKGECTLWSVLPAEDGIRDFHVTGVQTCALPILSNSLKQVFLLRPLKIRSLNDAGTLCIFFNKFFPFFVFSNQTNSSGFQFINSL